MTKLRICEAAATVCLVVGAAFGQIDRPVPIDPAIVTVSGTVVDDWAPSKRASVPLESVRVLLWRTVSYVILAPGQSPAGVSLPVETVLIDSATTNRAGEFSFAPTVAGSFRLDFTLDGFAPLTLSLLTYKDTSLAVKLIPASASATVAGAVWKACSDPLGMPCVLEPVARCTVTVTRYTSAPDLPVGVQASYVGVTNSTGAYTISGIPISQNGETVYVTAQKGGYLSQTVDAKLSNMATTTVNFVLQTAAAANGDYVTVVPSNPTTRDSLVFNLYNADICCCAAYLNLGVSVADTIIYLNYTVNDSSCMSCRCLLPGSTVTFESGPLRAGRYAIYKAESPYCAGPICPAYAIMPKRVGEVTVLAATQAVLPRGGGGSLGATAAAPAGVYDLRGKRVKTWESPVGSVAPGGYLVVTGGDRGVETVRRAVVGR